MKIELEQSDIQVIAEKVIEMLKPLLTAWAQFRHRV